MIQIDSSPLLPKLDLEQAHFFKRNWRTSTELVVDRIPAFRRSLGSIYLAKWTSAGLLKFGDLYVTRFSEAEFSVETLPKTDRFKRLQKRRGYYPVDLKLLAILLALPLGGKHEGWRRES